MRIAMALLLFVPAIQAEYLRIEQPFGGMECASCTDFVLKRLTNRPGVETAAVDPKAGGALIVTLKPGNTVRLHNVVDLVQQSGFKPGESSVVVRGTLLWEDADGTPRLKVSDSETPLVLADQEKRLRREEAGKRLEIEGTVSKDGAVESLKVVKSKVL